MIPVDFLFFLDKSLQISEELSFVNSRVAYDFDFSKIYASLEDSLNEERLKIFVVKFILFKFYFDRFWKNPLQERP